MRGIGMGSLMVLGVLMTGCAHLPAPKQPGYTALDRVMLRIRYLDQDGNPLPATGLPDPLRVEFPLIPGGLMGRVLTQPAIRLTASAVVPFRVDLAAHEERIANYATPLLATRSNAGLRIEPEAARLVRLGTFAYAPDSGKFIGPTGLKVAGAPGQIQLLLVYFDRPTRITGTLLNGRRAIQHDIDIDRSGFAWVEIRRVGERRHEVTRRVTPGMPSLTISIESEPVDDAIQAARTVPSRD